MPGDGWSDAGIQVGASMQINFIYDSSVQNAPAGFKQGLIIAANIIDAMILNPITVNIDIGFGEDNSLLLPNGTLGEAQPAFGVLLPYSDVVRGLTAAATSADDAKVVQNLPATDPSNGVGFFVSAAQSIAWGVIPGSATEIDGYAGFSSTLPFSYNSANGVASGTYDFVGVALHELTHALGRNFTTTWLTPINLLGYSGDGKLDTSNTDPHYLSPDGGQTNLASFDTSSDPADFSSIGFSDPFNASIPSGIAFSWTTLDSRVMDFLGYRTALPAPAQPPRAPPTPTPTPTPTAAPKPTPNFTVLDTGANSTSTSNGDVYSGPVAGIQFQFLSATNDPVNISSNVSDVFIRSGAGMDGLSVAGVGGRNVLDGGLGSNFLAGSLNPTSQDTFFVDDRGATADTWSTVLNAHAGDSATIWGVTLNDFTASWADGQGAPGFRGLTLHATAAGKPTASLTLVGYTTADLGNGHLGVSFGTVGGNDFLNVTVRG
jgi:hypothetical protein